MHLKVFDYKREELLGQRILDFINPEDREVFIQAITKSLKTGTSTGKARFRRKNGEYVWLEFKGKTFTDNESISKILLISRDITERKEHEKTIKKRLAFETVISKVSSEFVGITDFDVSIKRALADIGRLSGASRANLFMLSEDRTLMSNTHEWCADGVTPQQDTLQNLPCQMFPWWMAKLWNREIIHIKDISKIPKEAQAEKEILERQDIKSLLILPLYTREKFIGFIGFDNVVKAGNWNVFDFTILQTLSQFMVRFIEHNRSVQYLRESENNYRLITENANDLIAVLNGNFKFEFINNQTFQRLLGYSQKDLLGRSALELLHPADVEIALKLVSEGTAIDEGTGELRIQRKNGTYIWVDVRGQRFFNKDGQKKALLITRDITERKRTEEKLQDAFEKIQRQNVELQELNQMREEFYADVSHELRTPLISIKGYTELLLNSTNLKTIQQQDLRTILRNEQRLEHFIDEILEFASLKAGKIRLHKDSFRISEIIDELRADFQFQIHQRRLEIEENFGNNQILLLDRYKITSVVKNLFVNAVKFSHVDGKILIKSSVEDDCWDFSIRDSGIGILKIDLSKLFTRFSKLEQSNRMTLDGVGLGLSICKKIIDFYGGKIWVASEGLNKGATFSFQIPFNR